MYRGGGDPGGSLTPPDAVVLAREGGSYRVLLDGVERTAILRGKARQTAERAVAGDRVQIDPTTRDDEVLAIEAVMPRSTILERRTPEGRGTRPVAANIDRVVVVTAVADPEPVLQLIDRLLLVAEINDITPVVVANKIDLARDDAVREHLRATGYPVLDTSTVTGRGIADLRHLFADGISVMTGTSGVGKSSLLNAIEPGLGLRVGQISERVRRGRHTTTTATMVPITGGGFVVDTPGFSDVGVWDVTPDGLAHSFPEYASRFDECRFADCRHRHEPGCAIRAAVDAGDIPATRHESYLALLGELERLPQDWE